uniref:Glycosyltransferase family 2 protein n=1 Tax=Strongyloides venezuelensis TaxID=75913 RepID=A0A0K0EU02_STRVS
MIYLHNITGKNAYIKMNKSFLFYYKRANKIYKFLKSIFQ